MSLGERRQNFRHPDGSLWIAKFPSKTDRRDVAAWERVYAQLARGAGIDMPATDLLEFPGERRTYTIKRFDRTAEGRRLYASALTMTGRSDAALADYLDIARAIADNVAPARIRADLEQMYRRMAFNVLAGNRDDHLRNHGFLRTSDGWRLAPAFDINPAREMREHATMVNGKPIPTAADVLAARGHFGLSERQAVEVIREVADSVSTWRVAATDAGIPRSQQDDVSAALSALDTVAGMLSAAQHAG